MTLGNNLQTYNLVCGLAILGLVGLVAFDQFVPKKDVSRHKLERARELRELSKESVDVQQQVSASKKVWDAKLWKGSEDQASPQVLAELNNLAVQKGIKINSFRPQKPLVNKTLKQLGFVMVAEGSFKQMMGLLGAVEKSMPRVAVHQVQIASADGASDKVSATIGLAAYVEPPKASTPGSKTAKVAKK